ncbi:hypothetical protein DFP72DRAFT_947282 [Ephemerocybe angulata]|nr:hypothetical protein DFP72DRAFT_947282 [Tulosesus angulatus]
MHQYFKILRAREEIQRLDIEIRRVVTFIHDERAFLRRAEVAQSPPPQPLASTDIEAGASSSESTHTSPMPNLAHHIRHYANRRTLFFDIHLQRFAKLQEAVPSIAPALIPGTPVDKCLRPVALEAQPASGVAGATSCDEGKRCEAASRDEEDSDDDDPEGEEEMVESHTIELALATQD